MPEEQTTTTPNSVLARIANFFGLKRNLVILLLAIFVIGAGEELWMRFIPKYLKELGATVLVIGLYDAVRTLFGAIYAYPGGVVVDRWGHRRAFLIFNIISIIGYALVLLIPHWGAVIAGMFLFLSWSCFSLPATFSLVAAALEANRHSMGIGVQSVIKRLPIMIAPFFGGILIDRFGVIAGVRIALAISIVLSAATIFIQREIVDEPRAEAEPVDRWTFWQSLREFNQSDASTAIERHSGPVLRTDPVRVGRDLRDGLHRRERQASWDAHGCGNAGCNPLHHSCVALCRSLRTRTVRHRDVYHVHAVSG